MNYYKTLESYIEEIDRYLIIREGKGEILNEIRSHILEKTEDKFGKINDETLAKIIKNYGNPKAIAEKYIEDYQIISPVYKKYLFLYTGILFMVHYLLIVISAFTNHEMVFFPFFYIPILGTNPQVWTKLILYLPMTFFYDFGLICLILYFVTQSKAEIKLPWFELNLSRLIKKSAKEGAPKKSVLVIIVLASLGIIFVYLRFNALFFLTIGEGKTIALFREPVSKWLSLLVISIFLLEALHYSIRFFIDSPYTKIIKNGLVLIIIWVATNLPIKNALVDFPHLNLSAIFVFVLFFLAIIATISFMKSLIEVIELKKTK